MKHGYQPKVGKGKPLGPPNEGSGGQKDGWARVKCPECGNDCGQRMSIAAWAISKANDIRWKCEDCGNVFDMNPKSKAEE